MIKKLFVSILLIISSCLATSQVVEGGPTNAGNWSDGAVIVWKCPDTGPVISIPFMTQDARGVVHKGLLTCGVEDGTKITKPISPRKNLFNAFLV